MVVEMRNHQVILFPFMAQGHITPFLLLAEKIHQKHPNYTITIINTPLNIEKIKSQIPLNSNIHLKALPFQSENFKLPPNTETTASIPFPLMINLFKASESLQPAFENFISNTLIQTHHSPLCIIADHFLAWTVETARKFQVHHSIYLTCGAYGGAVYFSLWKNLPHNKTASNEFSLPEFPNVRIHRSQIPNHLSAANGRDSWSIFVQRQISCCMKSDAMLVNTVEVFEKSGVGMLRKLLKIPVFSIGPLLRVSKSHNNDVNLLRWLDSKSVSSTLYISFGSQNTISASNMKKLALSLEASCVSFIWVIRPPLGVDMNEEFDLQWLPEGFEMQMAKRNQGYFIHGWAPQVEILSHKSIGGFLSHCGWNSVLESLICGVPILGWPLTGDQLYNSKFLKEETGVCVEVARGINGCLEEKEFREVVEEVMIGDKGRGKEMREKAKKIGKILNGAFCDDEKNGPSARGFDEFLKMAVEFE